MATIEQRITALEQLTDQGGANYHLVICDGKAQTSEQRTEAEKHLHVIFVTFH